MKPLPAPLVVVLTRLPTGMLVVCVMQRPVALTMEPSAQKNGPPATTPTPLVNVPEYATCICTAMKPPDDRPETLTCAGSIDNCGNGTAPAASAHNPAHDKAHSSAAVLHRVERGLRIMMFSPWKG